MLKFTGLMTSTLLQHHCPRSHSLEVQGLSIRGNESRRNGLTTPLVDVAVAPINSASLKLIRSANWSSSRAFGHFPKARLLCQYLSPSYLFTAPFLVWRLSYFVECFKLNPFRPDHRYSIGMLVLQNRNFAFHMD